MLLSISQSPWIPNAFQVVSLTNTQGLWLNYRKKTPNIEMLAVVQQKVLKKIQIAFHKKKKKKALLSSTAFNNRNNLNIFLHSVLNCIKIINFAPEIVVFSFL